jgi:hypothetical protein
MDAADIVTTKKPISLIQNNSVSQKMEVGLGEIGRVYFDDGSPFSLGSHSDPPPTMKRTPPVTRMTPFILSVGMASVQEKVGKFGKPREAAVPERQDRVLACHRPGNSELTIVPDEAALRLRIVV